MKCVYETPVVLLSAVDAEDVITTSRVMYAAEGEGDVVGIEVFD